MDEHRRKAYIPLFASGKEYACGVKIVPDDGPEATWAAVGMARREAMRR